MNEKYVNLLMVFLGLLWVSSVFLVLAPELGLMMPVYPRPSPDYELIVAVLSGLMFAVFSLRKGVIILQS
jgi:hypothetical protein